MKHVSPHFEAFHGFAQLLMTGDEMRDYIKKKYKWSLTNGFANTEITKNFSSTDKKAFEQHRSIRLLGTFFSDSFDPNLLKKMIKEADSGTFEIKILMLDPYRDVAKKRGDALGLSPISAVEDALKTILRSLKDIHGNIPSLTRKKNSKEEREDLFYLLEDVHKYGPKSNVYVRFYHSLTDSPIYLISQFVIKGLILEGVTSEKKPWMVFVDSISQKGDIYDQYSNNFNLIFNNYRLDERGNPLLQNGKYLQDADYSRKWPIGLDISDLKDYPDTEAKKSENNSLKKKLLKDLEDGDLQTIIKELLELSDNIKRESLSSELYSLLGRFNHNESSSRKGIINNTQMNLERNKIRSHIIQLIQQLL